MGYKIHKIMHQLDEPWAHEHVSRAAGFWLPHVVQPDSPIFLPSRSWSMRFDDQIHIFVRRVVIPVDEKC